MACVGGAADECIEGCKGNTVPSINTNYNVRIFSCECPVGTTGADCELTQ
jgi:hypothetical protein